MKINNKFYLFLLLILLPIFLFTTSCEKKDKYDDFNNKQIQKGRKQLSLTDSVSEKRSFEKKGNTDLKTDESK